VEGPKASPSKWLVILGIYAGTFTTRDIDRQEYATETLARQNFETARQVYAQMGYSIWFAYLYDDQGNRTELAPPIFL